MRLLSYLLPFVLLSVFSFGQPNISSRDALRADSSENADLLLTAIEQQSVEEVRRHAIALIEEGRVQLVIGNLNDPSVFVRHGLVKALADTEQRQAIFALTDLYEEMLGWSVRGGVEVQLAKQQTMQSLENALAQLIGITTDPNWTPQEKLSAFRKNADRNMGVKEMPKRKFTRDDRDGGNQNASQVKKDHADRRSAEVSGHVRSNDWLLVLAALLFGIGAWIYCKRRFF